MPYIDHVHIRASDPLRTIEFFKTYFEACVIQEFENLGRKITDLSIGNKSKLSILHQAPAVESPNHEQASIDHIAIGVTNIEDPLARRSPYKAPMTSPAGFRIGDATYASRFIRLA